MNDGVAAAEVRRRLRALSDDEVEWVRAAAQRAAEVGGDG